MIKIQFKPPSVHLQKTTLLELAALCVVGAVLLLILHLSR